MLDTFAPVYRPDDVYACNLAGSLECVNAGITTLVDWSHINNTPEHPDAAIQRAQGDRHPRPVRLRQRQHLARRLLVRVASSVIPADDVRRVRGAYFSSDDRLLTMALATRGTGFCIDDVVRAEWGMARELGIPITVHVAMGRLAGRFGMVKQLAELGLLGPDTTYIHCCYFSDEEWQMVADSGGTISIAPQVEAQMGHGWPPVMKAIEYGLRPEPVHRRGHHRARRHVHPDAQRLRHRAGPGQRGRLGGQRRGPGEHAQRRARCWRWPPSTAPTSPASRTAPARSPLGKQADVVLIDATALNVAPIIDPAAAVVLCADVSNVDTVIIGGQVRKRDGKLLADVDRARGLVESSRDHLVGQVEQKKQQQA